MKNTSDENKTGAKVRTTSALPWKKIAVACGVAVLVAAGCFAFYHLTTLKTDLRVSVAALTHQVEQYRDEMASLQKTTSDLQQIVKQTQDAIVSQQQLLNDLRGTQKNSKDRWNILEAQYLVKLANDHLQVDGNVALVISMLQAADQKIHDASDPKLLPVRKALAADIVALQNVPQVDISGLYLRLSALNQQVDKLPLPAHQSSVTEQNIATVPAAATQEKSWWLRGLQQSWDALRQVVVVRHSQPGAPPFIAPDLQVFLYQNLHAALMQAMSALVQGQSAIYRTSLQQASLWTQQYFLQDSSVTHAMLDNLNQLQSVVIHPPIPAISGSLQAFRDYIVMEEEQPVTSTKQPAAAQDS